MAESKSPNGFALTVLGCGNMGLAIVSSFLSTAQAGQSPFVASPTAEPRLTNIIACVGRPSSVSRVSSALKPLAKSAAVSLTVHSGSADHVSAVHAGDIILLACQPSQAPSILSAPEMRNALSGKLLLSICVGLSATKLRSSISPSSSTSKDGDGEQCYIIHATPNTASHIQQSATVMSEIDPSIPTRQRVLADRLLKSLGSVTEVSPQLMNAASVTAASSPAFFALALEGVIRGAESMGIAKSDARVMAAQAMKGAAELVLRGEAPQEVIKRVMTPGGCTERGVRTLQGLGADVAYADAVEKAVERVEEIGRDQGGVGQGQGCPQESQPASLHKVHEESMSEGIAIRVA